GDEIQRRCRVVLLGIGREVLPAQNCVARNARGTEVYLPANRIDLGSKAREEPQPVFHDRPTQSEPGLQDADVILSWTVVLSDRILSDGRSSAVCRVVPQIDVVVVCV